MSFRSARSIPAGCTLPRKRAAVYCRIERFPRHGDRCPWGAPSRSDGTSAREKARKKRCRPLREVSPPISSHIFPRTDAEKCRDLRKAPPRNCAAVYCRFVNLKIFANLLTIAFFYAIIRAKQQRSRRRLAPWGKL